MKRYFPIFIILISLAVNLSAGEKSAKEYISDLSSDNDEHRIVSAAKWLGDKKEKKAIDSLLKLVDDERVNVRLYSIIALGLIGDEKAVEDLNRKLLEDDSPDVRYAALLAISRIGSKKSKNALIKSKNQENDPFIKDFLNKMEEKLLGK